MTRDGASTVGILAGPLQTNFTVLPARRPLPPSRWLPFLEQSLQAPCSCPSSGLFPKCCHPRLFNPCCSTVSSGSRIPSEATDNSLLCCWHGCGSCDSPYFFFLAVAFQLYFVLSLPFIKLCWCHRKLSAVHSFPRQGIYLYVYICIYVCIITARGGKGQVLLWKETINLWQNWYYGRWEPSPAQNKALKGSSQKAQPLSGGPLPQVWQFGNLFLALLDFADGSSDRFSFI